MTQKTIELASIDQAQELVIDERTIATYDAARGPLTVARLVNYGTLRIMGDALQEAQIVAQFIYNLGAIESDLPDLTLNAAEIKAGKGTGSFTAAGTLQLKSEGDLRVSGGTFAADVLQVTSGGKAGIHAFRLDANVKVKAKEVALGADDGNLNIVEQEIDGDPIFYQGVVTNGGNMNISVTNMPGEDVSLWAVGNITVNGPINTLGGDNQHPGRITIVGGQQKVAYNGVENDGLVPCVDCALPFPGLEIIPTPIESNTSVITTGNLTGKSVGVEGGTIMTGDIFVDNENIPVNFAGTCGLVAATSIKTGNIKVVRRDGANVRKGGVTASAGQNIDIGNVDGNVLLLTNQSGLIKVGNVDADFGAIQIKAGNDFGGGGGGIIGAAATQQLTSLDAKIQTGALTTQAGVLLMANGVISTKSITVNPEPFSGPNSFVIPHDVRIHANIGKDVAPAFLAGGGGTNGSDTITVKNRSYVAYDGGKAGVIAISNGPNGDIHLNGNRLKCVTGDKGTPGIVADAGSGQIRLVGGSPLSVDGDASHDAGFIILMGGELRAPNAAVVSASDTQGTAETEAPTVILAVDKITLPGSLVVNCNGNTGTSIKLAPKGSAGLDIVNIDYTQPIKPQGISPVMHELAIVDTGSLKLTANSKNGAIFCWGDPLRFSTPSVTTFTAQGENSSIKLSRTGTDPNAVSLAMLNGQVILDADNNQTGSGGTITIEGGRWRNEAEGLIMSANGVGSGNGGTIDINLGSSFNLDKSALLVSGGTTGDGGVINIAYKSATEVVIQQMLAKSGSANGGKITINNKSAGAMNLLVTGAIDTLQYNTEDLSGFTKLGTLNENGEISLKISENGDFHSVLSAAGNSVTVVSDSTVRLPLDQLTARSGPVSITADDSSTTTIEVVAGGLVRTTRADGDIMFSAHDVSFAASSTVSAFGRLTIEAVNLNNATDIRGKNVDIQMAVDPQGSAPAELMNSGTILASDTTNGALTVNGTALAGTNISGGGTLQGCSLYLLTTPVEVLLQFTGSQVLRQRSGVGGFSRIACENLQVRTGAEVLQRTFPDASEATFQISARRVDNLGVIRSTGALFIESGGGLTNPGLTVFGLDGILNATSISLVSTYGDVDAEQKRFRTASGATAPVGGSSDSNWHAVAVSGDLLLGQVTANGQLLAESQTGSVIVSGGTPITAVSDLSLFSAVGSVILRPGCTVKGRNVYVARNAGFQKLLGLYDGSKITVTTAAGGQVYFGTAGVSATLPVNFVSATGTEIVFDAPSISLNGGVHIIVP